MAALAVSQLHLHFRKIQVLLPFPFCSMPWCYKFLCGESAQVEYHPQFYEQAGRRTDPWFCFVFFFPWEGLNKSLRKKTSVLFDSVWLGFVKQTQLMNVPMRMCGITFCFSDFIFFSFLSFINVTCFYVFLDRKNLLSSTFTKGKQREKQAYVLLQ